jgi:hypothetical protein
MAGFCVDRGRVRRSGSHCCFCCGCRRAPGPGLRAGIACRRDDRHANTGGCQVLLQHRARQRLLPAAHGLDELWLLDGQAPPSRPRHQAQNSGSTEIYLRSARPMATLILMMRSRFKYGGAFGPFQEIGEVPPGPPEPPPAPPGPSGTRMLSWHNLSSSCLMPTSDDPEGRPTRVLVGGNCSEDAAEGWKFSWKGAMVSYRQTSVCLRPSDPPRVRRVHAHGPGAARSVTRVPIWPLGKNRRCIAKSQPRRPALSP